MRPDGQLKVLPMQSSRYLKYVNSILVSLTTHSKQIDAEIPTQRTISHNLPRASQLEFDSVFGATACGVLACMKMPLYP